MTLGARLRHHASVTPAARAVFAGDRWWSYGELVAAVEPFALAVGAGDVVAIAMARGIEVVFALCATVLAGATPAVIDPADGELAVRTVARLRPAAVIGAIPGGRVLELVDGVPRLAPAVAPPWQPEKRFGLAHIIYTSSSTADAKGIAWSEARAEHDWALPTTPLQRAGPGGIAVPLCSALGLQDLLHVLYQGLATVLLDVPFRAGLEEARVLGVNRVKLTPTQVDVLLATTEELPALRSVLVASAPIAPERLRALAARLPAARVGRSYGLTESGAATTVWLDRHPAQVHTVGRAIAFRRITIRDREGRVLPPRTWGEVVIEMPTWDRGDGYLDAPPELARRFDNAMLWTGDRGRLDARGFLVLGPRHAEILKVGGRSVSAPRIEESLRGAGGIRELVVVGVPDRALGQVACAVFVPAPGCRPDMLPSAPRADEFPRWFLPRATLPRGPTNKLRRGLLGTEAARWTSAFPQFVAPDHRTYPAYALDPRVSIVDTGIVPWFGDPAQLAPAGRVIALVTRRPVRLLALGYLQANERSRFIVGPFATAQPDGDVAGPVLDVFTAELIRLVTLLPGDAARFACALPARDPAAFRAAGFVDAIDGWLARGHYDPKTFADVARAAEWARLAAERR